MLLLLLQSFKTSFRECISFPKRIGKVPRGECVCALEANHGLAREHTKPDRVHRDLCSSHRERQTGSEREGAHGCKWEEFHRACMERHAMFQMKLHVCAHIDIYRCT